MGNGGFSRAAYPYPCRIPVGKVRFQWPRGVESKGRASQGEGSTDGERINGMG